MASNSRQTSVVEQHPEVGSTTGAKHQISILEVKEIVLKLSCLGLPFSITDTF